MRWELISWGFFFKRTAKALPQFLLDGEKTKKGFSTKTAIVVAIVD